MPLDAEATIRLMDELPPQRLRRVADEPMAGEGNRWTIERPKALLWKTVLLAASTLAFVPVLLSKSAMAGAIYVAALVAVHVIGLVVIVAASGKSLWADKRGLLWRLGGIALLSVLLAIVGKGLTTTTGALFWGTLILVWALHTVGAVIFHVRGDPRACPIPGVGA